MSKRDVLHAVAILSLGLLTGGTGSNESATMGLTPPVRLLKTSSYVDGGTLCFVLADARGQTLQGGLDGRILLSDATCPWQWFVGADHPTKPGARLLPLWGSEEHELVHLLVSVISDTASPGEVQAVLRAKSGSEAPSKFQDGGLWYFIRTVEGRRLTLEAVDHGLLAGTHAPQLFQGADTARVESVVRDRAANRYVVTFRDAEAKAVRIGYPASPDSVMNSAWFSGPGYERSYAAGTWTDRIMLTKVKSALDQTPGDAAPSMKDADRSALLELLELRRKRILAADKDC